jgi:hypothetical protein
VTVPNPNTPPAAATTQLDVLLAVTRLEGKLDGALSQQAQHDTRITELRTEQTALRDKVVSIEAQRRITPSWTATVPALIAVLSVVLLLARDLYGGR